MYLVDPNILAQVENWCSHEGIVSSKKLIFLLGSKEIYS